jgi:hypothetical protein
MRLALTLVVLLIGLGLPLPAGAAAQERCFDEVRLCISGPILRYWERNGGLRTFGLPITGPRLDSAEGRTLRVQWFERDRLELQADGTVTAGRLGARHLERAGTPWQEFPTVAGAAPGCAYFPVTGHQLCEPFLSYWRGQGGLERFGYPLTERLEEPVEGRAYQVQYFERRRMELHPELAGTPYEVLLGRLGAELVWSDSCVPLEPRHAPAGTAYRDLLGCPAAPSRELVGNDQLSLRTVPMATQRFEGGTMLWLREFAGDALGFPAIFVIRPGPGGAGLVWRRYWDEWREGTPTGVTETPPAGRLAPERGFGYLWATNAEVRAQLGWALAPEQGDTGGYRRFQRGFLLFRAAEERYYVVTDDGVVRDVPRQP